MLCCINMPLDVVVKSATSEVGVLALTRSRGAAVCLWKRRSETIRGRDQLTCETVAAARYTIDPSHGKGLRDKGNATRCNREREKERCGAEGLSLGIEYARRTQRQRKKYKKRVEGAERTAQHLSLESQYNQQPMESACAVSRGMSHPP